MKNSIIKVPMGKSNAYLIKSSEGYILVDAGIKGKETKVRNALKKIGLTLNNIKLIIITHVHYDHVGSLKKLQDLTNAKVMVHSSEFKNLKLGNSEFPKGTTKVSKVISKMANKVLEGEFEGVVADIIIDDVYDLRPFGVHGEVMHTPGHTKGSISVIIENEHFFSGDTFFNILKSSVYPPFADDREELMKSWIKIKEKSPSLFYPGHGKIFNKRKFLDSLNKNNVQ